MLSVGLVSSRNTISAVVSGTNTALLLARATPSFLFVTAWNIIRFPQVSNDQGERDKVLAPPLFLLLTIPELAVIVSQ